MTLKEILIELRHITALNYAGYCAQNQTHEFHWDGTLSYNGMKRLVYAIWNNGMNEKNQDIVSNMDCPEAIERFYALMDKCENVPMPIIRFKSGRI